MVSQEKQKSLYIKTWGCQMNVYDSNRMVDILKPFGYTTTDVPDDADMVILNTCHIREKATDKVFSELGRLRDYKEAKKAKGEKMLLAVAGCVAQAEGEFIAKRAPYVDMVIGTQTYHELPEMIAQALGAYGSNRIINTDFPVEQKFDYLPEEQQDVTPSAFLSIQEGCDKFCTFCVVPYTRGSEYSRTVETILDEAKRLIDAGAKEINVLGQNVNAFHGEDKLGNTWDLGKLLFAIAELPVERIRYTTSHPRDMHDSLYAAHRDLPKLMPWLHLPIQSGSDNILKHMNRKHTADDYKRIIDRLRTDRPDIAFGSDIIVGFPGETEEDFQATMDIVKYTNYSQCYSFKYSARPGTPAANMGGLVAEHIKSERLTRLQTLIREQQASFNKKCEGITMPVLIDRESDTEGRLVGHTEYNQSVIMDGNKRLYGQIIDVAITNGTPNNLVGNIVTTEDKTLKDIKTA
ncbi:MAG: tRNA (N6-isopentenyl adenosine(37)-C2)-methylthiotransferase MiaB [Micavibrio sp.]|nr:tRNA (N6-isopentenyl adenosine(37)-C2)-methylthiotransferase MiaB [Micavibrio sp.]